MDYCQQNHRVSVSQLRMNQPCDLYEMFSDYLLYIHYGRDQQHHQQTFLNEFLNLCGSSTELRQHQEYYQYLKILPNEKRILG